MNTEIRYCRRCGRYKAITEFHPMGKHLQAYCKTCANQIHSEWIQSKIKETGKFPCNLTGGIPMEQALTPGQCNVMRDFFQKLHMYARARKKPDVAEFLKIYREYRCGFRNSAMER